MGGLTTHWHCHIIIAGCTWGLCKGDVVGRMLLTRRIPILNERHPAPHLVGNIDGYGAELFGKCVDGGRRDGDGVGR